jgi:hypothetical protein
LLGDFRGILSHALFSENPGSLFGANQQLGQENAIYARSAEDLPLQSFVGQSPMQLSVSKHSSCEAFGSEQIANKLLQIASASFARAGFFQAVQAFRWIMSL